MNEPDFDDIVGKMVIVACHKARNTIGYVESENQKEFEKGMDIFINKFTPVVVEQLRSEFKYRQNEASYAAHLRSNLETVARIITDYAPQRDS